MSNLVTRVLVAVVGIPVILLVTMAGGFYFYAFVLLIALLAIHEVFSLARARGVSPQVGAGMTLGGLVVTVFAYFKVRFLVIGGLLARGIHVPFPSMAQSLLILFLVALPLIMTIELFRGKPGALMNIATTFFGASYVGLFLGSLVGLRELFIPEDFPVDAYFPVHGTAVPDDVAGLLYRWGGYTVIALFASIWVCDSAAYFAGRAFGRHKLFVRVSPNKTWEGAAAGFLAALGIFQIARSVLPYMSVVDALVCGAIVGVCGQIGDLAESLLKRDAGVKDSSSLIPGHGGVLDRFDSLLFVAPLVFVYLDFIVF
ncbi:MAG TPA: phosphatidate cytidylyltransferase [Bacteroidota bacterium]